MVLKVFLGMEIGRYDGYEFGTVLRTFENGYKLVFMEGFADEYGSWDSLWIAKPDDRFGWYGVDDLNVRTETGSHRNGWLERELRFRQTATTSEQGRTNVRSCFGWKVI